MIGVLGGSGLIGSEIINYFSTLGYCTVGTFSQKEASGLVRYDLQESYNGVFDGCKVVIISASINNIDKCFDNPALSHFVNVTQTIALIDTLARQGTKIVFLSTDQVFDGVYGGYSEQSTVCPANLYGEQKYLVEKHLLEKYPDNCIVARLSKTYGEGLHIRSMFSEIMENLNRGQQVKAATDQVFNPTTALFVAKAVEQLLKQDFNGLIHIASQSVMSRYEFAVELARTNSMDDSLVVPVKFGEFGFRERRGLSSWLKTDLIREIVEGERE